MSLAPADKVRIQQLRDSGALVEIFDTLRFAYFNAWSDEAEPMARSEIYAKHAVTKDVMREFNKAADGVENG